MVTDLRVYERPSRIRSDMARSAGGGALRPFAVGYPHGVTHLRELADPVQESALFLVEHAERLGLDHLCGNCLQEHGIGFVGGAILAASLCKCC